MINFGDTVVHVKKPEWGQGVVTRAENVHAQTNTNGKSSQRLHIRFAIAGLKVLRTSAANIQLVNKTSDDSENTDSLTCPAVDPNKNNSRTNGNGKKNKPKNKAQLEKSLLKMPDQTSDPFTGMWQRLQATLKIYEYTSHSPGNINNWAIVQTGMDDPLVVFTRPELDQLFRRWMTVRDNHLISLLLTAEKQNPAKLKNMLHNAHPSVNAVLHHPNAIR